MGADNLTLRPEVLRTRLCGTYNDNEKSSLLFWEFSVCFTEAGINKCESYLRNSVEIVSNYYSNEMFLLCSVFRVQCYFLDSRLVKPLVYQTSYSDQTLSLPLHDAHDKHVFIFLPPSCEQQDSTSTSDSLSTSNKNI